MRLLNRAPIMIHGKTPLLSERQILRAVRLPHVQRIVDIEERGVREAVTKAMRRASTLDAFSAVFRTLPLERPAVDVLLVQGSPTLLCAPSVTRLLAHARHITLMAVTLGVAWDHALDELAMRDEPAEAWFLDAIGTRMADLAARAVEDRVASDMARAGLTRTRRYRPGYGDWPLEAQAELCSLLKADQIAILLNEAYALLPRKTITGLLGWQDRTDAELPDDPSNPVQILPPQKP